jgi:cytochrome c1
MKTLRLLLSLFVGATLAVSLAAQTAPAAKAKGKADTKQQKKAEEEEGKVEGQVLNRPNGKFLGLTLQDGKYKLTFYDAKKKPEKVDVTRATARWDNLHGPGFNRTVLNPAGDGTFLLGAQFVRGPHSFMLYLTLIRGEGETADGSETYTIRFTGGAGTGTGQGS